MGQHTHINGGNLQALLTTNGSVVMPDENGFVTLTTAVYVFVLGGSKDEPLTSVHVRPGSAFAGVFTIEDSNLARYKGGEASGTVDIADWDVTGGTWIKEDPSTAYVATVGSGWTVANLTLTKTAAANGGAMIHLGNSGAKRIRLNVNCTTGGTVRVAVHGKTSG